MATVRFLHCADLHIDSPFKGIGELHPGFRDMLVHSTYKSYSNIIDLAISEQVDFVAICGDIYDATDKSLKAQLHFRDGLRKLADVGIPAFVVHGNHDPLDGWSATLQWPDSVKAFGGDTVEYVDVKREDSTLARVYGISYKVQDVSENLALQFKHENLEVPAIALLHANVGSNPTHKAYAPASIDDLLNRDISYWALGHVHERTILREQDPTIVYPGNSQARHPREIGAKGCYLVELQDDGSCSMRFMETDTIRYDSRMLDSEDITDIDELTSRILSVCDDASDDSNGRKVVLRITLKGRSTLHTELSKGTDLAQLVESIQEKLFNGNSGVLLNQIQLETSSPYDLNELRRGNNFVAELVALYDDLENNNSELWNSIESALNPLYQTWRGNRLLEKLNRAELRQLASQAMHLTLDGIVETE